MPVDCPDTPPRNALRNTDSSPLSVHRSVPTVLVTAHRRSGGYSPLTTPPTPVVLTVTQTGFG